MLPLIQRFCSQWTFAHSHAYTQSPEHAQVHVWTHTNILHCSHMFSFPVNANVRRDYLGYYGEESELLLDEEECSGQGQQTAQSMQCLPYKPDVQTGGALESWACQPSLHSKSPSLCMVGLFPSTGPLNGGPPPSPYSHSLFPSCSKSRSFLQKLFLLSQSALLCVQSNELR